MTNRNRPYFSNSLDQIKEEYNRNLNNLECLKKILHELSYRNTPQAKNFRIVVNKKISEFNSDVNAFLNKQSAINATSSFISDNISSEELINKFKQLEFQLQDFSKKTNNKLNIVLTLLVLIFVIVTCYSINFI